MFTLKLAGGSGWACAHPVNDNQTLTQATLAKSHGLDT